MRIPTVADLESALLSRGWVVNTEPYRLNIVILRKTPGTLDAFDDMLCAFWYGETGASDLFACRCTADPGKPARQRPKRRDGTAVWAVGQSEFYLGEKAPGTPNAYPAFRPVKPVPVLRYTSVTDSTGTPSTSSTVLIHRASSVKESKIVGAWSEGCTVVANPTDYDQLIALGRRSTAAGWPRVWVSMLEWPATS